jgi:hypothetical protein
MAFHILSTFCIQTCVSNTKKANITELINLVQAVDADNDSTPTRWGKILVFNLHHAKAHDIRNTHHTIDRKILDDKAEI